MTDWPPTASHAASIAAEWGGGLIPAMIRRRLISSSGIAYSVSRAGYLAMLTGKKLGEAIELARIAKGVTKKAMALHFGVKPPSIQDWVNRGTIDKEKLPALWAYFAADVGPRHWGLERYPITPQVDAPGGRDAGPPGDNCASACHPTLGDALHVFATVVRDLSVGQWQMVRARLDSLPEHPETRDEVVADILALVSAIAPAAPTAAPRSGEQNRTGTHG